MITEQKCYLGTCDNCGEIYTSLNNEYSLFILESDVRDNMSNDDWFAGVGDPHHEGKHYCPECFKQDPDIDDKIIVNVSRKNLYEKQ